MLSRRAERKERRRRRRGVRGKTVSNGRGKRSYATAAGSACGKAKRKRTQAKQKRMTEKARDAKMLKKPNVSFFADAVCEKIEKQQRANEENRHAVVLGEQIKDIARADEYAARLIGEEMFDIPDGTIVSELKNILGL